MKVRWVICPVDETTTVIEGRTVRLYKARVDGVIDPGRVAIDPDTGEPAIDPDTGQPYPKALLHEMIHKLDRVTGLATKDWCLCRVTGEDFSNLDSTPGVIDLFEGEYDEANELNIIRTFRVRDMGWSAAKRQRILQRLESRGIDTSDFTMNTRMFEILRRLARNRRGNGWSFRGEA